jgi:hypothetical protein
VVGPAAERRSKTFIRRWLACAKDISGERAYLHK